MKASKESANYYPKSNSAQKCSVCEYFIRSGFNPPSGTCSKVRGSIAPAGWCKFWSKIKSGLKAMARGRA